MRTSASGQEGAISDDCCAPHRVPKNYTAPSDAYTSTEEFLNNNPEITLLNVYACPYALLEAVHYRPDGSCRCDDSSHVEMGQWGYTWQPSHAEKDVARGRWIA